MKQNIHRLTLKYYWQKSLKYKWRLSFFFIAVTIAVIGQEFVAVLIYKQIFDVMATNTDDPKAVTQTLFNLVMLVGIVHFSTTFIWWRIAGFTNDNFQPYVMRDIEDEVFTKLQNHSYHFYANHFTGGLVSKTTRFVRSFEMIADIIQWSLFRIVLMFTAAVTIIYYYIPMLAGALVAWTLIYTLISYWYARWAIKFWKKNAKDDSQVTAELADSLTNIFNVKIFAAKKSEAFRFKNTIDKRRKSRSWAWMSGTFMGVWQGVMMISFEIFLIYSMIGAWSEGALSLGTIFAIQTFVGIVFRNLWELGRLFQDYSNGEILIDEQNISSITQDDLRKNIAYVPQDPILFHRTLKENIAYGKPNATDEEIIAAAKAAHAHDFIGTFTEGYDTLVGERGVKLSGGQKQRIAIARAMLKQAPILILDEATSSLDSKAEQHIQAALEELMKGRTTLVIAHRLSTLRQMDRIVVFERGRITEDGNHKQLTTKKGKYAELWEHQSP